MNYNSTKIMNGITNTEYPLQQKQKQHQQQQKCVDKQSNPYMPRLVPFVMSENITTIHPHDVLFCGGGRKGSSDKNAYREHEGNIFFHKTIKKKQMNYLQWSKKERERDKSTLIKAVINEVKGCNPPGRFLKEVVTASGSGSSSWILFDKKDYLAKVAHALFDKVDRFELKQKKQKNKQMIKNYLLSAAARVQAEELRMQSISSQQQRVVQLQQHQQQRKVAPPSLSLSQSQQPNNNNRLTIQDIHYQADHRLRLAQMQRLKVVEIERKKQQQEMQRRKLVEIERQKQQEQEMIIKHQQKAFVVQELQTRSQQLQELIQREQQRQFLQLHHQQETQRKIELKRQEQEQQNEQHHQDALEEQEQQNEQYHQDAMEEQERHTRCQKLLLLRNPLKLEHQRQLELIHKEQQRQLKQHAQLQLERKLQHQLTQLRRQQQQPQHQQQQFPHSANAVEDLQNTLHLITRSRSNTDETTPPPPPQPKEVGSTSLYGNNNEFLLNKKPNILNDALTNDNVYMMNKQRTLESLLFAANVPKNKNKDNDSGNLVSAPNSFNNINNANEGKTSNYALTAAIAAAASAAASAAVGVSDNINHSMIPFSTVVAPQKHHPKANETYESKNHEGYGSSGDDSKTSSLVF